MSDLKVSRDILNQKIQGRLRNSAAIQPGDLVDTAYKWYYALKAWERKETFFRAFQDNRMTMRLLNAEISRSANDYQREVKAFNAKEEEGRFKKTGLTQVYLSGGLKGMKDRFNPANFEHRNKTGQVDPTIQSKKNELGLHDLSARLLDKRFDIGKQGYNLDKTNYAVFMPVPKPEDHELFYQLNFLAKSDEQLKETRDFIEAVLFMRARLTRIKLAEETDMGAGFIVLKDLRTGRTRIRYGLSGRVTEEDEAAAKRNKERLEAEKKMTLSERLQSVQLRKMDPNAEMSPSLTPEQIEKRRVTARQYKSVLRTANELGNNELAIAYREHNSPDFPMITSWPDRDVEVGYYQVQGVAGGPFYLLNNGQIVQSD